MMEDLKIYYDIKEDILFLARPGKEEEVVELAPGVNMELDAEGNLLGIEVFGASRVFKDVLKPMEKKLQIA